MFQDEAEVVGHALQNLTQVHTILLPQYLLPTTSDVQVEVYPEAKAEDASPLLQLFLFPNSVDLNNLNKDNVQVFIIVEFQYHFGV